MTTKPESVAMGPRLTDVPSSELALFADSVDRLVASGRLPEADAETVRAQVRRLVRLEVLAQPTQFTVAKAGTEDVAIIGMNAIFPLSLFPDLAGKLKLMGSAEKAFFLFKQITALQDLMRCALIVDRINLSGSAFTKLKGSESSVEDIRGHGDIEWPDEDAPPVDVLGMLGRTSPGET